MIFTVMILRKITAQISREGGGFFYCQFSNLQIIIASPSIKKNSVTCLGIRLTYILFMTLHISPFTNTKNSVIVCKGNKGRIIPCLMVVTNVSKITTKSTSTGTTNRLLRSWIRKIEQLEEISVVRIKHLIFPAW